LSPALCINLVVRRKLEIVHATRDFIFLAPHGRDAGECFIVGIVNDCHGGDGDSSSILELWAIATKNYGVANSD